MCDSPHSPKTREVVKRPEDNAALKGASVSGTNGRNSLARNVTANWAGHAVFIVAGFILPRLVNDQLGQERLGVWDFGWSTIAYLGLLNAGIASSVNRYVARYRATSDWVGLNRATSACASIFACTAAAAAIVTLILVYILPRILPESFADYYDDVQWLLLFIGLASALSMFFPVYNGVITGYQRYDLLNYIEAGCAVLLLAAITAALFLGYGLRAMGLLVFTGMVLENGIKFMVAHRVCPQLRLSIKAVTRRDTWAVATFGGKTFLNQISKMILYQGNSLLVAFFLGPAALAVYARAMALILHANKALYQFGRVLIPASSSLQAQRDGVGVAKLVLQGTRYSILIALPIVLVLTILGDSLLRIWMGSAFARVPILAILAVGHLASLAQVGAFYAMMGLNRHGALSLATLVAAILSLGATLFMLAVLDLGLVSVAISVGVSLTAVNLLVVPMIVSRAVGISPARYFAQTVPRAIAVAAPFAACLVMARVFLAPNDYRVLGAGLAGGGIVLCLSYWRWVLPPSLKCALTRRIGMMHTGTQSS